ncbi:MAG: type II secretion system F family protein [Patescibacteria group bacterium]|nr:type II secretion system F family protein [Patescibacteria group bacterium]MDD5121178.1 type II secretion system F family protein [Patescibacteria group bacterium]MDD5222012.1 type II secretion system F family protein [Patescibacteria group bacterium]MDD5395903.1 type II secretion system F family protein [Patescibacteria group bacterium]
MEFVYKAKSLDGETVNGTIDAPNERLAAESLSKQDLVLLYLGEKKATGLKMNIKIPFIDSIKGKDLVVFSRQLAVMVSAGVPLVRALEVLVNQTTNRILRRIVSEISSNIRGGVRLSSALASYPDVFDNFYVNMVRTGETSGKLDEVLNYLADEQEKNFDLTSKITGAMIYPIFILCAVAAVVFVMMTFVVPKLTSVLTESGVPLPLPTKIMITVAGFFASFWVYIIIIVIAVVLFLRFWTTKTRPGKYTWHWIKLHIPVLGSLFQKIYIVRFTRSLSTLLVGGVPLNLALKIVANVVDNIIYKDLISQTVKAVEDGYSVSTVFVRSKEMPQMLSQIMVVGEQTGQLDAVLDRMANFYAREIENILGRLTTLLEPVIVVLLGVVVAGIVAAVIMPMYNLANAIQ